MVLRESQLDRVPLSVVVGLIEVVNLDQRNSGGSEPNLDPSFFNGNGNKSFRRERVIN